MRASARSFPAAALGAQPLMMRSCAQQLHFQSRSFTKSMMEAQERPSKIRKLDPGVGKDGASEELGNVNDTHNPNQPLSNEAHQDEQISRRVSEHGDLDVPIADENGENQPDVPLSKNQQKKLRRKQKWEAKRGERTVKRKEARIRKKERNAAAREAGVPLPVQRRDGKLVPLTVILDCSFGDLMFEQEIVSLGSQLTRCYAENKKASFKVHLAVSSFGGALQDRFDNVLKGVHNSWQGCKFYTEDFVEVSEQAKAMMAADDGGQVIGALEHDSGTSKEQTERQGEIIYLSSDSDVTLTHLDPYSTYIIGGLVDRNRHKGICHKAAMDRNVKTAKLPIGEYIQMASRQVLTTNQVLEIMLKWLELGDWGKAFMEVIPKRKGVALKEAHEGGPALKDTQQDECIIQPSQDASDEQHVDADEEEVYKLEEKEASALAGEDTLAEVEDDLPPADEGEAREGSEGGDPLHENKEAANSTVA